MNTIMTPPTTAPQQPLTSSLEDRLPPLFERHHATVRYIRAGFYLDAIHSIIEAFCVCQPLDYNLSCTKKSQARLVEMDSPLIAEGDFVIDRNPMDPCTSDGKSPLELLFLAMHYNLALSYHLYASTAMGQDDDDDDDEVMMPSQQQHHHHHHYIPQILGDALRLYEESSIRMHNLDPMLKSALRSVPALQNNMRHVKFLNLQPR